MDNVGVCIYDFFLIRGTQKQIYDKEGAHKSFANIVMLKYFESTQN